MSDTTSPRFGPCREPVDALLAGARIFECGALPTRTRREIANNKNDGVSLTPSSPARRSLILQQQIRVNGRIRAREVRVIMGSTSEQLGVMKLSEAIKHAQGMGLDLVEVAPTANPPVCKIVDFGKFRYDISKQVKGQEGLRHEAEGDKFRVNIDEHDYLTKIRHGEEFLDKGNKVRVQLQFRGREMAHQEFGMQLMYKVRDDLATMAQVEMEPKDRRAEYHDDALAAPGEQTQAPLLPSARGVRGRERIRCRREGLSRA